MAIRDDVTALLRQELGLGYETALLPALMKAHVLRCLKPRLKALYASRLDDSALVAARAAKEQALSDEQKARQAARDASAAQLEVDLGTM